MGAVSLLAVAKLMAVVLQLAASANAELTSDGCFSVHRGTKVDCARPSSTRNVRSVHTCLQQCKSDDCGGVDYYGGLCVLYDSSLSRRSLSLSAPSRSRTKRGGGGGRHTHGPRPGAGSTDTRRQCHYGPRLTTAYGATHYKRMCSYQCSCGTGPTTQRPVRTVKTTPSTTTTTTTTTTTQALPAGTVCEWPKLERYILVEDVELATTSVTGDFAINTVGECLKWCSENMEPSGKRAPCRSATFVARPSGTCYFSDQRAEHFAELVDNQWATYFEKTCVDASWQRCISEGEPWSLVVPQSLLVGFAETVVDTSTRQQCMHACVDSVALFGFTCVSGMYFSDETEFNCILNTASRTEHPEQFIESGEELVDYFEPYCVKVNNKRPLAPVGSGERLGPNLLPAGNQWGPWSPCDNRGGGNMYRFRNCKDVMVNACDVQEKPC